MILDFVAFDFETADAKSSAPCSLGITVVKNGVIQYTENYFINPDCEFSQYAIKVHGITPIAVAGSPLFPEVWQKVAPLFSELPVVAQMISFDLSVLKKALSRYSLPMPSITPFDTCAIAQNALPNLENHKLSTLCAYYRIDLQHAHDSGCDSRAAASLFLHLQKDFPDAILPVDELPNPYSYSYHRRSAASYDNDEYVTAGVEFDDVPVTIPGKRFVLTGDVVGYPRDELQAAIKDAGGIVSSAVSSKTDYVVVGLQNLTVVKDKDHAKSGKIIKAEQLRLDGFNIKIVSSDVLLSALECSTECNNLSEDDVKIYTVDDVFEAIKKSISPKYLKDTTLELQRGSSYFLVTIAFPKTLYRSSGKVTLARIKFSGKHYYISFPPRATSVIKNLHLHYSVQTSDPWLRVELIDFMKYDGEIHGALDPIFLDAFNFTTFGCCGKYEKCSDAGHCLHDDLIYASAACEYKRHLDNGRVFYGVNKNI